MPARKPSSAIRSTTVVAGTGVRMANSRSTGAERSRRTQQPGGDGVEGDDQQCAELVGPAAGRGEVFDAAEVVGVLHDDGGPVIDAPRPVCDAVNERDIDEFVPGSPGEGGHR